MLFTTATFICLFLPVVLVGFFGMARRRPEAAALWLFLASVFFYGYWMPQFTVLLLASIVGNFLIGAQIASQVDAHQNTLSKRWLVLGVTANLALLSYFKYANFFIDNLNTLLGWHWDLGRVILPIGISFFTFTQIAYLVDTCRQGGPAHGGGHHTYFFERIKPHAADRLVIVLDSDRTALHFSTARSNPIRSASACNRHGARSVLKLDDGHLNALGVSLTMQAAASHCNSIRTDWPPSRSFTKGWIAGFSAGVPRICTGSDPRA